ncbi:hypothetical protein Scep_026956 [Stephania cephalantha]|uniref:non-specific serine/threonine protein kinase n=1 Tax=Stephania cephalantha TaxID=152367 RepID=A0AAP0HSH2_9MAGN
MILLCFLLLLLPISSAQTFRNITLGSTLSTLDENPYWVSPSGEFAFGFYSIKGDLFLLSIWFAKIPLKTIVWTANRDHPVEGGSKVQLTSDGVLSLTNHTGGEIWRAASSNAINAASAAVLDTGNLVLRSSDLAILWASFDEPTDTILPGQILDRGSKLSSSLSNEDHSSGKFQLSVKLDGNLVLRSIARPTEETYDPPYWATNTADTQSRLVFNESGLMYLITPLNGTHFNITTEIQVSPRDFYQRATIDFDGVFRKYTYPKSSTSRNDQTWSVKWYVPGDICTALTGDVGSGACGFNSYCVLGQDQRPNCECPPGYDYVDANNRFKEWCSNTCLDDCFCAVSIIRGSECWLKKIPLSNGRSDPSINGKALIKVGNSSLQPNVLPMPPPPPEVHCNEKREKQHKMILPGSIVLATSIFLNLLLILVIFVSTKHKRSSRRKANPVTPIAVEGNLECFTYKELEEATNGFEEELGKGACSVVYKGVLLRRNAEGLIAVKRLKNIPVEVDKEFKNEMRAIGRSNHKNLVKLLGFCDEGTHRLLVGREDPEILSENVYDAYVHGELELLIGDDDEEAKNDRRFERMVMVAIWCVQDDSSLRPSMRKVLQMLEGPADVPTPPDPFSYANSNL